MIRDNLTLVKKDERDSLPADGRTARRHRTRERVLRVARELIEQRGAPDVSMDDIAAGAGVTRRTLYDHFGSRAGLLVALAEQADRDANLEEQLTPVLGAPRALDAVDRMVDLVAAITPGMLDLATAIERARIEDPDASAAWDDRMASRIDVFRHLATRLAGEGELRAGLTTAEAADIIYAATAWQTWRLLVGDRGWSPQRWVEHTKGQLRQALTGAEP